VQDRAFDDALGASYRLLERHGQGATGEVWRAVDRRTDEIVAAKLLRREYVDDGDLVGRFVRERSILTGLRHPNIVTVRDLVVEGDRLAIVMDFVEGGSLREVLRQEGPLRPAVAVGATAAVLDGLAAAHDEGVVHRDMKPDNVLLSGEWRALRPGDLKLTDFGIARLVADSGRSATGILGTPEYMSPELLTTGESDQAADVYGVGILLYELLAGRTPFAGSGTDYTVAHRHVSSEPPRLPVPTELWEALTRLLDKDPSRRPAAAEAAAMLRRLPASLAGLPALPRQSAPAEFAPSQGPATLVRGLPVEEPQASEAEGGAEPAGELDLGAPGQMTTLRPMSVPESAAQERRTTRASRQESPSRPPWRDPKVVGMAAGAVLLVVAAVLFAVKGGSSHSPSTDEADAAPVKATQQDRPTPAGLTIERSAVYDPHTRSVELTITYDAQSAPLRGPFLEVIPGLGGTCPSVSWQGAQQKMNLPSTTGVTTPCAWSVDPGVVPKQDSVAVKARVALSLPGKDPSTALTDWLDGAAAKTASAVGDPEITSTAYPVQRLQAIDVVAPSRIVNQKTLPLTLLPVWPSGADKLDPIYHSPSVGAPSSLLTAIAGGEDGVRFSDACSGAVAVSSDGLVVTALSVASDCRIDARVGNFTDLESNPFQIVTRGG